MEKEEGIALNENFKIRSYPTFIFFDPAGNVIYRTTGEFKADGFTAEGMNTLNPEKQLPALKKKFESNLSDAENCYNYIRILRKAELDCTDALTKYFSAQSQQLWVSEVNWRIIANGVTDMNSPYFQFVLTHQQEFAAVASPERVKRKIFVLVKDQLLPAALIKDSSSYLTYRKTDEDIHDHQIDSLIFAVDLKWYGSKGNWNAYKDLAQQKLQQYGPSDEQLLKDILYVYRDHITDKISLAEAAKWADHLAAIHEAYNNYIF